MSPTRRIVVLGLVGCLGGCRAAAQAPLIPPRFDPAPFYALDASTCAPVDSPGDPVSLVGLTEDVNPSHAPIPGNESERLLFRQVYETLLHIGCDFTIRPGLAATWQLDATGTGWIITLRRDARFSDGTAVTARDVIASWTRGGSTLHPDVSRFVRTATALDDFTLSVVLQQWAGQGSGPPPSPGPLAQPALAVARFAAESPWPLGTREVRLEGPATPSDGRITITMVPAASASSPDAAATTPAGRINTPVRFLVSPRRDARDLLDQGVDLLVTRDPAALAYANTLAQFDAMPLPWLRSYVFVSREKAQSGTLTSELRQQLADDAVPGEAQGSSYDWPQAWGRCANTPAAAGQDQPPRSGRSGAGRIVYDSADAVARALAERIAALTARSADSNSILDVLLPQARARALQVAPVREPALSSALVRGDDAGFIIAVDRTAGCAEIASLRERVPWVTQNGVVPLVDTRLRAVVRRGRSRPAMEWDGSLLIGRPVSSQ